MSSAFGCNPRCIPFGVITSATKSYELRTERCNAGPRFQLPEAHGPKNGSSFGVGKSRRISAVFGRMWTKRLLSLSEVRAKYSRRLFAGNPVQRLRQYSEACRAVLRYSSGNASIDTECRSQSLRLGVTFSSITALTAFAATNGIKRSKNIRTLHAVEGHARIDYHSQ